MLEVSATATEKLAAYLKANKVTLPMRIIVMHGGSSGPALALALDETKSGDAVFEQNGLTFIVEKDLLDQLGDITIDYLNAGIRSGFHVCSSIPLPGGGCCGSGTCGTEKCDG